MDIAQVPDFYSELLCSRRADQFDTAHCLLDMEGVVIVGAGRVGFEFLAAFKRSNIEVFAYSDNDRSKWGTTIAGIPVLPPAEAVDRFGRKAVFLVAIGRVGSAAKKIGEQFSVLGAKNVTHFLSAIKFIPTIWPVYFLNPLAFSELDSESVVEAYRLLEDEESRSVFIAHLSWRMTLDPSALPIPYYESQYFPGDIIKPSNCSVFIDIGAYTGDTLLALRRFAGDAVSAYYGFEPDTNSYCALATRAREMSAEAGIRAQVENVAIGATEKSIAFSDDGSVTSHAGGTGANVVQCKSLDSLMISNPTFVKIDTEGFEDEVLSGADVTLRTWQPTIAIASYHRPKDIFELPARISNILPGHKFYLRPHGDAGVDLVCYAIAER